MIAQCKQLHVLMYCTLNYVHAFVAVLHNTVVININNIYTSAGLPGWGIFLIVFFVLLVILSCLLLLCLLFFFFARKERGQYSAEKRGK